jgi:hypothetical protein
MRGFWTCSKYFERASPKAIGSVNSNEKFAVERNRGLDHRETKLTLNGAAAGGGGGGGLSSWDIITAWGITAIEKLNRGQTYRADVIALVIRSKSDIQA